MTLVGNEVYKQKNKYVFILLGSNNYRWLCLVAGTLRVQKSFDLFTICLVPSLVDGVGTEKGVL